MFSILAITSCSTKQDKPYDVRLTANIEQAVFKNSVTIFETDEVSTERFDKPIECEIAFGNKKIVVDLTSVKNYVHKSAQQVYFSKDKNIEYRKSTKFDSFTIQAKNDTVLATYTEDTLNEQLLNEAVIDFMSAYIDIATLNEYVYSCTTSVVVTKPTASWKETRDGFSLPSNNTESVTTYKLEYRKFHQEFATSDSIVVMCTENGDITGFYYYEHNIDWAESVFKKELINNSIDSYIKDSLSKEYNLLDISIESERLVYLDDEIQLAVSVELTLLDNNEEVVVLCPLLLSD